MWPGSIAQHRCRLSPEGIGDGWLHCLGMGHGQHSWQGAGCVPQQAGRAPLASRPSAHALQAHNLQQWGSLSYKGGSNGPIRICTALLRDDANCSPTHARLTTHVHRGLQNLQLYTVGLTQLFCAFSRSPTRLMGAAVCRAQLCSFQTGLDAAGGSVCQRFQIDPEFPCPNPANPNEELAQCHRSKEATKGFLVCFISDEILLASSASSCLINTTHALLFVWKGRAAIAGRLSEVFPQQPWPRAVRKVAPQPPNHGGTSGATIITLFSSHSAQEQALNYFRKGMFGLGTAFAGGRGNYLSLQTALCPHRWLFGVPGIPNSTVNFYSGGS